MNIGVYPGSFDPITVGHMDVVEKSIKVVDELHIVVAVNRNKKHMFTIDERSEMVKNAVKNLFIPDNKKIVVVEYEGIISDYVNSISANIMIRGIRSHMDLAYEQNIEQFTKNSTNGVVTVYFSAEPEHMFTSSSLVRQFIMTNNDAIEDYIPMGVFETMSRIIDSDPGRFIKEKRTESCKSANIIYSS